MPWTRDEMAARADLLAARYLAGHASKADVEQCIRVSTLVPAVRQAIESGKAAVSRHGEVRSRTGRGPGFWRR